MSTIRLYFDADAQDDDVVSALRLRGVDVEIANDVGLRHASDPEQLAHAAANGRTLYSFNVGDFASLHAAYLAEGKAHSGIILAPQQRYSVGEQMRRLLRLVQTKTAEEMRDTIEFLGAWG